MLETQSTTDYENSIAAIQKRIHTEPSYTSILYKILAFCSVPRSVQEIDDEVNAFHEMKINIYSPQVFLQWLVDVGGIEECAGENGEAAWRTTGAGMAVVDLNEPAKLLENVFAEEEDCKGIFLEILQFCREPKSTKGIEQLLEKYDTITKRGVYPSYFVGELEKGGGLEWNEGWRTTPAGRAMLMR